jgi:hypothetical protein
LGAHVDHDYPKQVKGDHPNGTLICSACAVIVISANPPGNVARIIVAEKVLKQLKIMNNQRLSNFHFSGENSVHIYFRCRKISHNSTG